MAVIVRGGGKKDKDKKDRERLSLEGLNDADSVSPMALMREHCRNYKESSPNLKAEDMIHMSEGNDHQDWLKQTLERSRRHVARLSGGEPHDEHEMWLRRTLTTANHAAHESWVQEMTSKLAKSKGSLNDHDKWLEDYHIPVELIDETGSLREFSFADSPMLSQSRRDSGSPPFVLQKSRSNQSIDLRASPPLERVPEDAI